MKRTLPTVVLAALIGAGTVLNACGVTSERSAENCPGSGPENRFQTISHRNAFALKAAIRLPTAMPPPAPTPKISVLGLTDLGGISKALLEITETGRPLSRIIVREGDAAGLVRILRIDVPAGTIKVSIEDLESTLLLKPIGTGSGCTLPGAILPMDSRTGNSGTRIKATFLKESGIPWPTPR